MNPENYCHLCRTSSHSEVEHLRKRRLLESRLQIARLMSYGPLRDES